MTGTSSLIVKSVWPESNSLNERQVHRSTHTRSLEDAKGVLGAFLAEQKALTRQGAGDAQVVPLLMAYWKEHGKKSVNRDQTGRSLRTFIGFLLQDGVGVGAVVTDLIPTLFERFREWRMAPHRFEMTWGGQAVSYSSECVSGATVQRNINDIRAAVHHAQANLRIPMAPKIRDLDQRYQ